MEVSTYDDEKKRVLLHYLDLTQTEWVECMTYSIDRIERAIDKAFEAPLEFEEWGRHDRFLKAVRENA